MVGTIIREAGAGKGCNKFKDLRGMKFGRWTVISQAPNIGRYVAWRCQCQCGKDKAVIGSGLRSGMSKSCGCWKMEQLRQVRHGMSHTAEHRTWAQMRHRCTNSKLPGFKNYGGRGITVCERWMTFENFFTDMGPRPKGMTLDRKDNNGNYEPGNCRWATGEEQQRNKRNNRLIAAFGKIKTLREWSMETGISDSLLCYHLKQGKTLEQIVDPKRHRRWRSEGNDVAPYGNIYLKLSDCPVHLDPNAESDGL